MKLARPFALFIAALIVVFVFGEPATAAPAQLPDQASEHARVVDYWTSGRVARAMPRDLLNPSLPREEAAKPGDTGKPGGGGGGGSGSTSVTGATWTGGGAVRAKTGKALFTLNGVDYVCSGAVVADTRSDASIILTAGHCVFDDATDRFATNWMFIPDYQSGGTFSTCSATTYGCWVADVLLTTTGWAAGNFGEDYAFVVAGANSGNAHKAGVSDQLDTAVGGGYELAAGVPSTVTTFGYPAAGKYNGRTLTYCRGAVIADPYGATASGVQCDMTGGSSGGPMFSPFSNGSTDRIVSLNSYKYSGGPYKNYMFGPRFDQDTLGALAVANSVELLGSDRLVPAP